MTSLAETKINEKESTELLAEVETYKKQLTSSLGTFRKANVVSACVIDKLAKEDLLSIFEEQNSLRKRRDKQGLANVSNQVTDKLLSISRHLAETTQKSGDTLDTLCKNIIKNLIIRFIYISRIEQTNLYLLF